MPALDDPATFSDSTAADAADINRILARYQSPIAGQGKLIEQVATDAGINPLLLLAIMQEKTVFGRGAANDHRPELAANPFAIHFSPKARGMAKLRMDSGELPTFRESLLAVARQIKASARDSRTPLSSMARQSTQSPTVWANAVEQNYRSLSRHVR